MKRFRGRRALVLHALHYFSKFTRWTQDGHQNVNKRQGAKQGSS